MKTKEQRLDEINSQLQFRLIGVVPGKEAQEIIDRHEYAARQIVFRKGELNIFQIAIRRDGKYVGTFPIDVVGNEVRKEDVWAATGGSVDGLEILEQIPYL